MVEAEFDLPVYAERIGYVGKLEPTLAVLNALVGCHAAAVPFENIDALLGRGIRLDADSLRSKLLQGGRGGYCFEQNALLQSALQAIGFTVTGLMARVVRGAEASAIRPRTHMLLLVDLPEGPHLADVGFGNLTATAALRLTHDVPQSSRHEAYRLTALDDEHVVEAQVEEEWQPIYRFPLQRQFAIDYEVANWFTATCPGGLFTENLIVARPGPGCRDTIFNRRFTRRWLDGRIERQVIADADGYQDVLCGHFGLRLSDADLAAIDAGMHRRGHGDAGHPAFV